MSRAAVLEIIYVYLWYFTFEFCRLGLHLFFSIVSLEKYFILKGISKISFNMLLFYIVYSFIELPEKCSIVKYTVYRSKY